MFNGYGECGGCVWRDDCSRRQRCHQYTPFPEDALEDLLLYDNELNRSPDEDIWKYLERYYLETDTHSFF